jgi:hypothetical protein
VRHTNNYNTGKVFIKPVMKYFTAAGFYNGGDRAVYGIQQGGLNH